MQKQSSALHLGNWAAFLEAEESAVQSSRLGKQREIRRVHVFEAPGNNA